MFRTTITIDPENPQKPLPVLATGLQSDGSIYVAGAPEGFQPVFTFVQTGGTTPQNIFAHHPTGDTRWLVKIGGWNFAEAGTVDYNIFIREEETEGGEQAFCGSGTLVVRSTLINAVVPTPPPVDRISLVSDSDGNEYRLRVSTDPLGDKQITIDQDPYTPEVQNA